MSSYPNNATLDLGPLPRDSWKDPARTDRTVAAMTAVIHSTDRTKWARTLADKIVSVPFTWTNAWGIQPRIMPKTPLKVYSFLRAKLDFARDPEGVELVRHPDQMIAEYERTGRMHGDCDDLACLGAALCRARGYQAVLIVAGRKAQGPFEHVYYGIVVNGLTIPFDPQEKVTPGFERKVERRKVYQV